MLTQFRRLLKDESGTTAIEYGLIAALVSVAIVGTLTAVGGDLKTVFTYIGSQLTNATSGTGTTTTSG
jgi:pilus assembly protein Flp/PilA